MSTRVLVPSGVLGLGFDTVALQAGIADKPHIIAIDGGSTDSGPFYLGSSTSKYSRAVCKSEWRQLMQAREVANVPLVITSCGTCGTDDMVDWMFDITREIASELKLRVKVATLYSEQNPKTVQQQFSAGDVIAALPLARSEHAGAAWHGAKIAECGAFCTTQPKSGVIALEVDADGFSVWPLAAEAACTPHSVSAHMLYENADPMRLYEPGGALHVHSAKYNSIDQRSVRVTGSKWVTNKQYTVKLEGARCVGYQSTLMAVLREARYVENAKQWVLQLTEFLHAEISNRMNLFKDDYSLEIRLIGLDSALGDLEVTAASEGTADELAKLINPFLLHYPLTDSEALPTFAFPYSPAQTNRGAQYEFCLNHVLNLDDPMDAFRIEVHEL